MISTLRNMRGTAVKFAAALVLAILLFAGNAFADCQGEFTPMADSGSPFQRVHFFPKNGNQILIDGVSRTIPPGVGVISGGLIGDAENTSIDKVPGQRLAPLTLYYVYAYWSGGAMVMDFSTGGHKEDLTYGNEVHVSDPDRSLIGMVRTDANRRFVGSANSQMTLSWCNRVRLGVIEMLTGDSTSSSTLVIPNPAHKVEWLQWGINSSFLQGATSPNIYVQATVGNTVSGAYVNMSLAIDGVQCGLLGGLRINSVGDAQQLGSFNLGAAGTDEGYHYAQVLLSNGGSSGTVNIGSGAIWAAPVDS